MARVRITEAELAPDDLAVLTRGVDSSAAQGAEVGGVVLIIDAKN